MNNTVRKQGFLEKKEQQELFNWLHKSIDLPKRVYEIHDMLNLFNKLDFSINDYENNIKIIQVEHQLKTANEAILQTLKTIEEKKQKVD
jgi:Zn-dependent M32 family carboxypeptidase